MDFNLFALIANVFTVSNVLTICMGTFVGIIIGAIPGLTATMGVALFIPLTYALHPETGLLLLASIYGGSVYGGSITAILIRTPGTPDSIFTAIDGYGMTRKGQGGKALAISAVASGTGGMIGNLFLLLLAPPLAAFAVKFGPAELFLTSLIGLTVIIGLVKDNLLRGLVSCFAGLLVATVGVDQITGLDRYTMDNFNLFEGFPLVPVVIGLFSVAQVFNLIYEGKQGARLDKDTAKDQVRISFREYWELLPNMIKSSIVGTIIGIVPGAGMTIAAGISINEAKRVSKHPETFGHGEPHVVCAAEASNNAVVSSSLIPLLTLSIPGNGTAAVFLGGLLIHGLRPGMDLFTVQSKITYTVILGVFLCNIIMMATGLFGSKYVARFITRLPSSILAPSIMTFSIIGAYAIRNNLFDVGIMLGFGVFGFFLERLRVPLAPFVLAFVLGPIVETQLRRALIISQSSSVFEVFSSPIAIVLILLNIVVIVGPFYKDIRRGLLKRKEVSA